MEEELQNFFQKNEKLIHEEITRKVAKTIARVTAKWCIKFINEEPEGQTRESKALIWENHFGQPGDLKCQP